MLNGTENIWERIDKDSWLNYVWCSESKQGWWLTYLVKRDRYPIHTLTNGIFFCSIKILKLGGKHITDRLLSLLSNGKYSFPDDTFLLMRRTGAASSKNRFCVASRRDVVREAKERFCFVADRVSEYRVNEWILIAVKFKPRYHITRVSLKKIMKGHLTLLASKFKVINGKSNQSWALPRSNPKFFHFAQIFLKTQTQKRPQIFHFFNYYHQ
jgi:hypothetical protein